MDRIFKKMHHFQIFRFCHKVPFVSRRPIFNSVTRKCCCIEYKFRAFSNIILFTTSADVIKNFAVIYSVTLYDESVRNFSVTFTHGDCR